MLESLIVLRDALYELPGGFKDTTRAYRSDREAGGCPTSIEHVSDAQMFVERALFNRNALSGVLPESVFSARLAADPERQLVFRCALAEFGASAFQGKNVDLEELSGDRLRRARESYGNSPLRLNEKGDDKLRRDFCHGWPPIDYDNKTMRLIASVRERYVDVFDDAELDRFLKRAKRDQERYQGMAPGADAFKKIMQTERGQDSLLWGLDLWDRFDDDPALGRPPVEELVARLSDAEQGPAAPLAAPGTDMRAREARKICFDVLVQLARQQGVSSRSARIDPAGITPLMIDMAYFTALQFEVTTGRHIAAATHDDLSRLQGNWPLFAYVADGALFTRHIDLELDIVPRAEQLGLAHVDERAFPDPELLAFARDTIHHGGYLDAYDRALLARSRPETMMFTAMDGLTRQAYQRYVDQTRTTGAGVAFATLESQPEVLFDSTAA